MSTFALFLKALAAALIVAFAGSASFARSVEATISMTENSQKIVVSGRFTGVSRRDPNNLVFTREFAGTNGLADRISDLKLDDAAGNNVSWRRLMAGEYLATSEIRGFSYSVDLSPSYRPAAHVSWLSMEMGVLFAHDLLPQVAGETQAAGVNIVVPNGWGSYSGDEVFVVARERQFRTISTTGDPFILRLAGDWNFADTDAITAAREIFTEYKKLFGQAPKRVPQINIVHFPADTKPGVWEADTRGQNVTILSSDAVFKSQSVQRLHEQLRHEMFHLWLPNDVDLSGRYDWFYEGAALYSSLKIALALNRIRFDDFLVTLSNALAIDALETRRTSLIAASEQRFTGNSDTYIYARGLLVAFLSDLEMLKASKAKVSFDTVVQTVHGRFRFAKAPTDATKAILAMVAERPELAGIVKAFVTGAEPLDISLYLTGSGLEASAGRTPVLSAKKNFMSREKAILNKLGYNNWRKLQSSK